MHHEEEPLPVKHPNLYFVQVHQSARAPPSRQGWLDFRNMTWPTLDRHDHYHGPAGINSHDAPETRKLWACVRTMHPAEWSHMPHDSCAVWHAGPSLGNQRSHTWANAGWDHRA